MSPVKSCSKSKWCTDFVALFNLWKHSAESGHKLVFHPLQLSSAVLLRARWVLWLSGHPWLLSRTALHSSCCISSPSCLIDKFSSDKYLVLLYNNENCLIAKVIYCLTNTLLTSICLCLNSGKIWTYFLFHHPFKSHVISTAKCNFEVTMIKKSMFKWWLGVIPSFLEKPFL